MKPLEISIVRFGVIEKATVECDRKQTALTFTMHGGFSKTYYASDFYVCFGMLRADLSEIKFLCKGAKRNVHPSRMSSQMSKGLVSYELKPGKSSEDEDLVRIFDYEDEDITNNIEEQKDFYRSWIATL